MSIESIFTPCSVPSNEHAYTNMVYMNPADYQMINKNNSAVFIELNKFIVKVGKAKEVQ